MLLLFLVLHDSNLDGPNFRQFSIADCVCAIICRLLSWKNKFSAEAFSADFFNRH